MRDPDGNTHRVGQRSEVVFTGPTATRADGDTVVVEDGALPDVVLQWGAPVDAGRRQLSVFGKWGFSEVWVAVPDRRAPGLRQGASAVAIHIRTRVGYVQASRSTALPSWSAAEIYAALNEPEGFMSDTTTAALRRVGRLMRADTGKGPDDDPILRAEQSELRAEPTMEDRIEALDEMFRLRGCAVSPSFTARVAALQRPLPFLLRAAYDCLDEDDFLERIAVVREVPLVL